LWRTNLPKAKAKLQELADKLPRRDEVKSLAGAVIKGLDAGATKFADDAALCRQMITGLNAESVKGTFECLKMAFRAGASAAGAGIAQGLYDEFINLLRTNLPKAKAKLQELADKLPAPDAVKSLAGALRKA